MWDFLINVVQFFNVNAVWVLFAWMFFYGTRHKSEWTTSVRSLMTMIIGFALVDLATDGKISPKDFMLIVSLVFNYYFLVKQRAMPQNGGNGGNLPK